MIKEIKIELAQKEIKNLEEGGCTCFKMAPCEWCIKASQIAESYDLDFEDVL